MRVSRTSPTRMGTPGPCKNVVTARRDSTRRNERSMTMGLSWQQGPLAPGAIGHFLVTEPLPKRLLYAEPLRRRMRVRFGGTWIADSEHVLLLFEPGRYPVAYFPETDVSPHTLERTDHTTRHPTSGSLPGTPSGLASTPRRQVLGSTPHCPRT